MARELAFTYVPAGSAKHERKDFSAGESISIRFVRVGSDSVAGQTFRYVVSPSIDGSAPLFSSTSFTIEADGDLVIGLATADTYAWASGDYQGELRRVDSGYNTVCRKTVHGVKENPLNNGTPPVIPDNEVDWDHVSGTPTTLAGYGITDSQAGDATLTALAGVTTAADKLIYATGSDTFSTTTFTAAARTVLDDTTVSAMVDTLGGASSTGTGGLVRAASPTFTGTVVAANFSATTYYFLNTFNTLVGASPTAERYVVFPDASGTFVLDSATQALTNKTYNGNTITTGTGTLTLSTFTLTVAGTASVSGTNTGDQDLSSYVTLAGSQTLTNKRMDARDAAITADSPSGTTFTLDLSASDVHSISTLAADSTIAISNTGTQKRFAIIFLDNTSNKAITWFSGVTWLTPLTQPALGAKISVASFIKTGSGAYLGWMSQQP